MGLPQPLLRAERPSLSRAVVEKAPAPALTLTLTIALALTIPLPLNQVCRRKCECPKHEHELRACTERSRREHRMSSDENIKRSQRRRSPVLGLRADDPPADRAKAYSGAWAKENRWYRRGANGAPELLPTSVSSNFKYQVSMDLVKWTQHNEVDFNCSDGSNRSSASMFLPNR